MSIGIAFLCGVIAGVLGALLWVAWYIVPVVDGLRESMAKIVKEADRD